MTTKLTQCTCGTFCDAHNLLEHRRQHANAVKDAAETVRKASCAARAAEATYVAAKAAYVAAYDAVYAAEVSYDRTRTKL